MCSDDFGIFNDICADVKLQLCAQVNIWLNNVPINHVFKINMSCS